VQTIGQHVFYLIPQIVPYFVDEFQQYYLLKSKEKCIFATQKVMFTVREHKFNVDEHMYKDVEYKFTVREHKIYRIEKEVQIFVCTSFL
jgi:hypothetical protein